MIEEKKEKATIIMGEKIYLLPISEKDTEKIIKWRNQPEVKNFFLERNTTTTESHNKWLYDYVYTGRVFQWIIYEILEDCPIGTVYLKDVDYLNRKCEFGIFIGEINKRQFGYGTEACVIVCEYAFNILNLAKVFLKVIASNQLAFNVYQKAGFVEEGYSKMHRWINDTPIDVIYMAKYNQVYTKK